MKKLKIKKNDEILVIQGKDRGARGKVLRVLPTKEAAIVERIYKLDSGDRRPLVVRPTNLEDVFLAVTGTSLEENQA